MDMSDETTTDPRTAQLQKEAEEWAKKTLVIEADILKCDEPMTSGNIYPRAEVEKAVAEIMPHIEKGEVLGEFNPTGNAQVMLVNSTHVVEGLELKEDGTLHARLRIIPTDPGKALVEYIRAGGFIKMAPRGFGNSVDGKIEGYQLVTVDIYRDYEAEKDPAEEDTRE
jgi:hypothetical protein